MQQRERYENRLTALLFLTFGTVMLDRMTQVFLGPYLVADLHLTPGQVGLLAAVLSVCWAGSTFAFGMISDRIGRRRVLIPAVIAFSLCSWLAGVARTFEELLIARALLGLAEGPCWSVVMALMEESSSVQRRGRNIGIVNSAGSLVGSAIAPIFCTQVAEAFGWRAAFFAAGLPGLVLAVILYFYVEEPPRSAERTHSPWRDIKCILGYRELWLCFMGAMLLATWLFCVSVFAPLYITQVGGQTATTAGFLLGASGLGGFLFGLFWPTISDRFGRKPVLIVLGCVAALLPIALLTRPLYETPWLLAAIVFCTTAGPAIAALVMILMPAEIVKPTLAATAIGFASIGAELFGATLSPLVGGAVAERYGLHAPLVMAATAAILIAVIGIVVRETAKPQAAAASQRQPASDASMSRSANADGR